MNEQSGICEDSAFFIYKGKGGDVMFKIVIAVLGCIAVIAKEIQKED